MWTQYLDKKYKCLKCDSDETPEWAGNDYYVCEKCKTVHYFNFIDGNINKPLYRIEKNKKQILCPECKGKGDVSIYKDNKCVEYKKCFHCLYGYTIVDNKEGDLR